MWFTPRLRVSYRPRANVRALARQYLDYGRWRRVVSRTHEGTVNLRYLAPPRPRWLAILLGLLVSPFFPLALIAPGGYAVAIVAGSVLTGSGLPAAAKASCRSCTPPCTCPGAGASSRARAGSLDRRSEPASPSGNSGPSR